MTALNRPGNCVLVVGVPLQAFGQFQLPLDSIETAGKRRGEDQVEVGIRAWHAIFNADSAPSIVDDTNRASAVIHAPGRVQWRPGTFDIALVGVDDRGV